MNKGELVDAVASATKKTKKDVEAVLNGVLDTISTALQTGDKVTLVGFGTFEVRKRQERNGRNPRTGEVITIPETKVPAFAPGKPLKEKIG